MFSNSKIIGVFQMRKIFAPAAHFSIPTTKVGRPTRVGAGGGGSRVYVHEIKVES